MTVQGNRRALSPEIGLLVSLAIRGAGPEALSKSDPLMEHPVDWEVFQVQTVASGLIGPVYRACVRHLRPSIPASVLASLRSAYQNNVVRSLRLTGELIRILQLFDVHGIEVFAYKGPVLGQMAYGDPCMRSFCDLDLFLRPGDVLRAKNLLLDQGFEPEYTMTPAEERFYLLEECEYNLVHHSRQVVVELHWKVAMGYASFGIENDELWHHIEPLSLMGKPVPTLSAEYTLLVMAVHGGGKHHWERIGWILDVVMLVEMSEALDWEKVLSRGRKAGLMRTLLVGLLVGKLLFDIALPSVVEKEIDGDSSIGVLAARCIERYGMGSVSGETKLEHLLFSLGMREGLSHKVSYLVRQIVTSSYEERKDFPLPAVLRPLYGIVRLGRWAAGRR